MAHLGYWLPNNDYIKTQTWYLQLLKWFRSTYLLEVL